MRKQLRLIDCWHFPVVEPEHQIGCKFFKSKVRERSPKTSRFGNEPCKSLAPLKMDGKKFRGSGFRFFFWGGAFQFRQFFRCVFFLLVSGRLLFPPKILHTIFKVPFCPKQRHGVVRGEISRSSMDVTVENHS